MAKDVYMLIDLWRGGATDGEEQDAYILGVNKPIKEFTGKVIAVIHRFDDVEEKLVVVPTDASLTKEEIKR